MNPELSPAYARRLSTLPRAAVTLAAASVLLAGCAESRPESTATPAISEEAQQDSNNGVESPTASDNQTSESPAWQTPEILPSRERRHRESPSPSVPSASHSASAQPAELPVFWVTGDCEADGELGNWSKNFTPYGSTLVKITQPDGTAFAPVDGAPYYGVGNVDGIGHSQWSWPCKPHDALGEYAGTITDFGPDNKLGTADDQAVNFTFTRG